MSMREQRLLAPAKINTYLEILGKRDDGFHELETVFQCIDVFDEITLAEIAGDYQTNITYIDSDADYGEQDICWRAVELVRQHCSQMPGIAVSIAKDIPVGAGLGGASSDAATILKALGQWYDVADDVVAALALELGSDVPFFLHGGCAYARGRGEQLHLIDNIIEKPVTLLLPAMAQETAAVFAALTDAERGPRDAIGQDAAMHTMRNRLEAASRRLNPGIEALFQEAQERGVEIHMSGSGSSCFSCDQNIQAFTHAELRRVRAIGR